MWYEKYGNSNIFCFIIILIIDTNMKDDIPDNIQDVINPKILQQNIKGHIR